MHGRDDEALDRLFLEPPGELATDVEEIVELEHLDRQLLIRPAAARRWTRRFLDGARGAGRHAAQEAALLGAVQTPFPGSGPRPSTATGGLAAMDWAQQGETVVHE
jgi:hypothetical protein